MRGGKEDAEGCNFYYFISQQVYWINLNNVIGQPDGNYAYPNPPSNGNESPVALLDFGAEIKADILNIYLPKWSRCRSELDISISRSPHDFTHIGFVRGAGVATLPLPNVTFRYVRVIHRPASKGRDGIDAIEAASNISPLAYQKGYPVSLEGPAVSSMPPVGAPTVSDIDGDGHLEILVGTEVPPSRVYAFHCDGTPVYGWHIPISTGGVWSSVTIGDIDNDGDKEILVGTTGGEVYAWHHDGKLVDGWPFKLPHASGGGQLWVHHGLSLGDIDGDRYLEIIFSTAGAYITTENKLYVLNHDASVLPGWPIKVHWSAMQALGDINGDGDFEIVVYEYKPEIDLSSLYVLDENGTILEGWPFVFESSDQNYTRSISYTPIIGDIDNDGKLEVAIAVYNKVYVLNHNGTLISNWPVVLSRKVPKPITMGDVNGDGNLEIIVGTIGQAGRDGYLHVLNHEGIELDGWPITGSYLYTASVIADIDNDDHMEIIVGTNEDIHATGYVYAFNHNGTKVPDWPVTTNGGILVSPAVADLDGDKDMEVIICTCHNYIYVWDVRNRCDTDKIEWGMYQHDPWHTGRYGFKVDVENQPPIAIFVYSPENPIVDEEITFNSSNSTDPDGNITSYEWDFGDGNITNTTELILTHSYASAGTYNINLTVTDDGGVTNSTNKTIIVYPPIAIFDTGSPKNPYPSIMGNHTGTIEPNHTVIATKLYTYPCEGTGGHTEYAKIWNLTWNATATWKGYVGDWHNITFDKTVVLLANKTYNYTIRTGSYPQIIHESPFNATRGEITCTKFTDANGKVYYDWIPAIRLWA